MKVSVLGAGAIGSMFGGLIKHHSPDTEVVLVTRGDHLRQMKSQGGVRLIGPWGDVTVEVEATEDIHAISGSDFLLLTVKSYSTHSAMTQATPHLGDATVISIQNGINQPTLAPFVSPDRLVMGMTATSIAIDQPGTVNLRRNGLSVIGPASAETADAAVQNAANVLRKSSLPISVDSNVIGAQYNKLIFNTLGAASSLSDGNFIPDAIIDRRWRNSVAIPLQQEALRVLDHANIELLNIPDGSSVWKFRRLLRMMNVPILGAIVRRVVTKMFQENPIRFSIGEDLRRGRATEIDSINGEIVRLAEQAGTTAPYNTKVIELLNHCATQGIRMDRDQVVENFGGLR